MACQYAYYGVPLKRYCKQNNLNYGALYHYLKRHEKEDIIENLIDCYISAHRSYRFHYINNITLQEYLKYTNIKYSTVINTLSQKRKNPKYSNVSEEELLKIVVKHLEETAILKALNISKKELRKYLIIKGYSYEEIIDKMIAFNHSITYLNLSIKEKLNIIIEDLNKIYDELIYNDLSLKNYCKKTGIEYHKLLKIIGQLKNNKEYANLSLNELIKIAIDKYLVNKRTYQGMILNKYCSQNGIVYNSIKCLISKINRSSEYQNLTVDEIISTAISIYEEHMKMYKGNNLAEYCLKNGIIYESLLRILNAINKDNKFENLSREEKISQAIQIYGRKKEYYNIREIFNYLKGNTNEIDIKNIAEYLNLDYENIMEINQYFQNLYQTITFIYYFYDDENNKLKVSKTRLEEILNIVKSISHMDPSEAKNIDIKILFGLYKCNLLDTRYLILLNQEKYINCLIKNALVRFDLPFNHFLIEEIKNEIDVFLLELLEKIYTNIPGKYINYINISIYYYLINYLNDKYYKNKLNLNMEK